MTFCIKQEGEETAKRFLDYRHLEDYYEGKITKTTAKNSVNDWLILYIETSAVALGKKSRKREVVAFEGLIRFCFSSLQPVGDRAVVGLLIQCIAYSVVLV